MPSHEHLDALIGEALECADSAAAEVRSQLVREPVRRNSRGPPFNGIVRRCRVITSRIGLVPLEPDGERLVAYLEPWTPWDS